MGWPKASRILAILLLLGMGAFLAVSGIGSEGNRPKVFVFYPSLARPLAIQDALSKKCPGLDITVFARLTDLQALVEREHPQAILAQNAVLRQFPEYRSRLQGERGGLVSESYVLLSIDKPFEMEKVSTSDIGVVGMLDRKQMTEFVDGLLPGSPHINRVTKVEDLLPLLIFRSVAAVLVSEANMKEFQKKSQAKLVATVLDKAKVGLVAVGVKDGSGADGSGGKDVLEALKRLDAGTLSLVGVDAWK
jgi:hypothetical protein